MTGGRLVAGLRTAWPQLVLALVAFAAVFQVIITAPQMAPSAAPIDVWDPVTWMKFDSGLYANLAVEGYQLYRCGRFDGGPELFCGNAGWFPGYSFLVGGFEKLGLPLEWTGVIVSWLFTLATLVFLSLTFFRRSPAIVAAAALALAAFWPGGVYFFAFYPLSMMVFCTVLVLWFLTKERWLAAGVAGAIGATSYYAGVLVIPVAAVFVLAVSWREPWRERLRRLAIGPGVMSLGALFVVGIMRLQTNTWDAYFKVQDKYRSGTRTPGDAVTDAIDVVGGDKGNLLDRATFVQTILVAALMLAVVAIVVVRWRRKTVTRLDWLVLGLTSVLWVFPLFMNNVALHRSEATLLPMVLVLRHLPAPLVFLLTSAAVWIYFAMTQKYALGGLF